MCFCCDSQMDQIRSLSRRGTPRVSVPCGPENASRRLAISIVVTWTPRVFRRMWVDSSFFLMCLMMSSSDGFGMLELASSATLAFFSKVRSSLLHSKMHWDRRAMKVPYSGCESVEQPVAKRRMKCHASRRMMSSFQAENKELTVLSPQQSRSVYRRIGGETPANSQRRIIPDAIERSPLPSAAVRTLIRTCPNSFPTLVIHAAVPAAVPVSFLVTWECN